MTNAPLILASASPRRKDLLSQIKITPDHIIPADICEDPLKGEKPPQTVKRLALEKARKIAHDHQGAFVLGADTIVACGHRELPKAETTDQALTCLKMLSGRRHSVLGGIALITPSGKEISRVVKTSVQFKRLNSGEINTYIESREWEGKAGGYAIQGICAAYIKSISGSYSNVVGLSLYDVRHMLIGNGFQIG